MKKIAFPYGKEKLEYEFNDEELLAVIESSVNDHIPLMSAEELVKAAMAEPVGSPRLAELARGKNKIVIIASDHTRPVPSKIIIPPMLDEIRSTNPKADITILIATGCHRGTTRDELIDKFGEHIVKNEKIYIHDCDDHDMLVSIGALPSGGKCEINKIAYEADLLVAEGFIEPHLFAGFSGGRKSVLPGICSRNTVMANHCSEFIAHERARTGILDGNPVHTDMLWAAKTARLCYIVNVILNDKKEVIFATAGDVEQAHRTGTDFLASLSAVRACPADIAITTNGGYPLDQNVYQAVKGMTAAEATVKEGGVIIMLARSDDGTGGEHFYKQLTRYDDVERVMENYLSRSMDETYPDQWQGQILARILLRAHVIYVSSIDDEMVRRMHMIPAHSIGEAVGIARKLLKNDDIKIVAIPDGIAVIVK